jgi:hypothetical protein
MRRYSEAVKADVRRRMSPPTPAERCLDLSRAGHSRVHPLQLEEGLAVAGSAADKFTVVLETARGFIKDVTPLTSTPAGLIQSMSQAFLPGLRAWVEVGWIASSQCPRAFLPPPIST